MLKETIKYTDYNGNEVTEDVYFNLTKPELIKLQASVPGGFAEKMNNAIQNKNTMAVVDVYDTLIRKAYGVKSEDGKRFQKTEPILNAFLESEAYATIFMNVISDAEYAQKFVNGILPADLLAQVQAATN